MIQATQCSHPVHYRWLVQRPTENEILGLANTEDGVCKFTSLDSRLTSETYDNLNLMLKNLALQFNEAAYRERVLVYNPPGRHFYLKIGSRYFGGFVGSNVKDAHLVLLQTSQRKALKLPESDVLKYQEIFGGEIVPVTPEFRSEAP